ncbi:hypothetical protein M569_09785 [Genlisea aurea]|uniref:Homeobox-leucine zipper protein n=1 Tax=Genlisea aurea TaxID=192259 RepID=S8CDG5_9LAMI|nr:hypothetical protein M569_09785 [Genlisea aurea]
MKRRGSSESLGALISICPSPTDEQKKYLETMLGEEEGCVEESSGGHVSEKKRRLSVEQVKALEKNFEVENKLEPERKMKLAQELGLQPRQVAVWFQNRRARWKTKQLERDYGVLKANYDALKLNFEKLQNENEALVREIEELKKEEEEEEEEKGIETAPTCDSETETKLKINNGNVEFLGGISDSDSSAILNEEINNNNNNNSNGAVVYHHHCYQPHFVKLEEQNFLGEESCSTLFCDDQPPTLQWYSSDDWN